MRDIAAFFRSKGQGRSHNVEAEPVNSAPGQAIRAAGNRSRPTCVGGPHMQQAQQAVPNAACGRSSNSKSLGANTSAPLTSIDQSSDVLRSHKDDYQHWTHFVCSQADGVTADVPKVQYRLDEPLPGRQHASAPASNGQKPSCYPQRTPPIPSSGPKQAPACTSVNASAVSEQTAARLSSSQTLDMRRKLQSTVDLSAIDMKTLSEPASALIHNDCNVYASLRRQAEVLHSTPPKRVKSDWGSTDDCATMSLTLAGSTPSTTWRTPAVGLDAAQSVVDCDGSTSCMQDMTPVLKGRTAAQASPNRMIKHHNQHPATCAVLTTPVSPMAASSITARHSMAQQTVHVVATHVSAHRQDAKASGTLVVEVQAASQTSSLYSDGIDEILATVSTPESAKKRFNDHKAQTSGAAPACSGADAPRAITPETKSEKVVVERRLGIQASAVVPAERLDVQESAVVKQLLQWGKGGLAPSLMQERAALLHRVLEVLHPEQGELRLLMLHMSSKTKRWAHLFGAWADTDVSVGDTANVIVDQEQWVPAEDGILHCVIDNGCGSLFVLHPDMLISGTSISSALRCPRQAMLQEKGVGSPSRAACLGTLMHELAQSAMLALNNDLFKQQDGGCMSAKVYRPAPFPRHDGLAMSVWGFMMDLIPKLVAGSVMQITEVGLTQREAEHELRQAAGQLARTLVSHFRQTVVHAMQRSSGPRASIEGLLDIEESIWAPRYGLKGVIDATIISRTLQHGAAGGSKGKGGNFGVAALEFKSGKVYQNHAAQLGIYGLLLNSRYGADPVDGLLWYSRNEDMDPVCLGTNDVAGLMMTRNRLAAHKARGAWALPPPLRSLHTCRSCMVLPLCAAAHHAMEGGTGETFGLPEQFANLTEHLTQQGSEFFRHWLQLLEMEQTEDRVPQSNIWAIDPPLQAAALPKGVKRPRASSVHVDEGVEAENISPNSQQASHQGGAPDKGPEQTPPSNMQDSDAALELSQHAQQKHPLVGRCIGSLIKVKYDGECSNLALYPFVYTFSQSQMFEGDARATAAHEMLHLSAQGFAPGDCGILSIQDRHVAVNRARVLSVTSTELKLALRSRLPAALDALTVETACGQSANRVSYDALLWRLDKDEPETAFQCAVSGLLELMLTQSAHAHRMRGLIVNHDAPHHSAKENYSQEAPVEEDCFAAMVESERQQTLGQACSTGTQCHANLPSTCIPQTRHVPVSSGNQHPGRPRPMSAPALPQHQTQSGCAALNMHSHPAGLAVTTQHQQRTTMPMVHSGSGHVGVARAAQGPPQNARSCCQDRSSSMSVYHEAGSLPYAVYQGIGQRRHTPVIGARFQTPPAACSATQLCNVEPSWTHGRGFAARGSVPVFQQPPWQTLGRSSVEPRGSGCMSQRCSSAPVTHGKSGAPSLHGHSSMRPAPTQQIGTMVGHAVPRSGMSTSVCTPLQGSYISPAQLQSAHNATAQIKPGPALTPEQQEVVNRALAWDDYVLVMGLPGAGKTYTIAACVQALVAQGRSVLLSAYTNAALDNMLRRVLQAGETRLLRIGRTDTVHPDVAPYVLRVPITGTTAATLEIRKHVRDVPVVGVTCLSAARAPLLRSRLFDVCILDEATQVTLPASLSPIMRSRTFVLVGDHLQLPPLVRSREAQDGGLGVSLFKMLSDQHPHAVVTLKAQHRMCAPIMALSNELTYDSRLRAATDAVAAARLCLPLKDKVMWSGPQWLQQVIARDPAVLWLDTRQLSAASDHSRCSSFCNPAEVSVTKQIVQLLLSLGADASDVGVTSPYNQQVRMLQNSVGLLSKGGSEARQGDDALFNDPAREHNTVQERLDAAKRVAVMTIDKFQGQDKAAMVISLVRSNVQGHTGTLLSDCRRINVALTRAKHKLVIIGNSETLCNVSMLKKAFGAVQRLGGTIDLKDSDVQQ